MKVKTISAMSEKRLDEKVNHFLESDTLDVVDIKFTATIFYIAAMIIYR